MPDGMTPENGYNQFKIGGPTRLPANEASMEATKQFSTIEDKQEALGKKEQLETSENFFKPGGVLEIDIRNQIDPEENKDTHDQTKDLMDYLRANGRIQSSEIMQFSDSLRSSAELIKEQTTFLIAEYRAGSKLKEFTDDINKQIAELEQKKQTANPLVEVQGLDKKIIKLKESLERESEAVGVLSSEIVKKQERIDGEKEKLPKRYNDSLGQCLNTVEDVYNKSVKNKKNAYPYDHRIAEGTVETLELASRFVKSSNDEVVTKLREGQNKTTDFREKKIYEDQINKLKEYEVWSQRAERDAKYLSGFLEVTVGQTASLPWHFDVIKQLMILDDQYRAYIGAEAIINMNQSTMEGLEFDQIQANIINNNKIGINIPEGLAKNLVEKGEVLGLKEIATKFQDDSFEARMKVAAVSQCDLTKTDEMARKQSFLGTHFTAEDFRFYKKVFGVIAIKQSKDSEGNITRKKQFITLSPHVSSKYSELKQADARLEAILLSNAVRKLENIHDSNEPDDAKNSKVDAIADEVLNIAKERIKSWGKRGDTDIISRMSVLVNKQGFLQDYSFMHAYRYCWNYDYDCDENGNPLKIKEASIASVLSRSGDLASLYFLRRTLDYDRTDKSRTPWMLPSSEAGRTEVLQIAYDRMPMIFDERGNFENTDDLIDSFLKEQFGFLFDNTDAKTKERADLGYTGLHPKVIEFLKKRAVKWRTPYAVQDAMGVQERDKERYPDVDIVIPVFMHGLDIANFFEAITDQGGKLNAGEKSAWTQIVESQDKTGKNKVRNSDIQYNPPQSDNGEVIVTQIEDMPVNRWLIDERMAANYMNILINVFDKQRESFLALVAGNPSTLGPKDMAKKMMLTFRDAEGNYSEEYELGLIPFFISQAVANKYNISSGAAWEKSSEKGSSSQTTGVENFVAEMALWKRAFKWLAADRTENFRYIIDKSQAGKAGYNDKGYKLNKDNKVIEYRYGHQMALLAEFYETLLLRMGKSSAEQSSTLVKNNYENTANRLNSMTFMKSGYFNNGINKDINMPK